MVFFFTSKGFIKRLLSLLKQMWIKNKLTFKNSLFLFKSAHSFEESI